MAEIIFTTWNNNALIGLQKPTTDNFFCTFGTCRMTYVFPNYVYSECIYYGGKDYKD